MKIRELVRDFPLMGEGKDYLSIEVSDIACSSKCVKPGGLFVAIRGSNADGHEYLREACEKGASCIAVEGKDSFPNASVPILRVKNTRAFFAHCASHFFSDPSKSINLIGITGTNGKTTTAFLIRHIIEKKYPCALLSTLTYQAGTRVMSASLTTPDAYSLNRFLREVLTKGIRHAVMEVSSHALDQDRAGSIRFRSAIFTNLTWDHLDYHQDMEKYFLAKRRLFLPSSGIERAVINADDPAGMRLKSEFNSLAVTYGLNENSYVRACNIQSRIPDGLSFDLVIDGKTYQINSPLLGKYNVYNILAAAAETYYLGYSIEDIVQSISEFKGVTGRMEVVGNPKGVTVIVDYAHTPDAFQNVLSSVKDTIEGRLIAVFGCGGNRDRGKRPEMGRIAAEYADYVVLTSDNPRHEDPAQILKDIVDGISPKTRSKVEIIAERKDAIREAMDVSREGDTVLILGKGHETYQIVGDERLRFSDQETVLSYVKKEETVCRD